MKTLVTILNFEKFKKGSLRIALELSPFDPLQPQNYPKICNSVTIWKKAEFERNNRLHFWLHFLIDIKKNCNQLILSSGYKLKIEGYKSVKKQLVTVTNKKISQLTQKSYWLQNYNFLALISEEKKIRRVKTS